MNPQQEKKEYGVYINSMLSKKVVLKITEIGKNIKQNLEKKIKMNIEGKCIAEGFIRPKTVEVISYSCGLVKDDHIEFQVIYRCLVCNPIKDVEVDCVVKNITKAGIHAEVKDNDDNVPVIIFVARDHNYTNSMFDKVEKDAFIRVKIIGVRFELNDPSITAIAHLLDNQREREKIKEKDVLRDVNLQRDLEKLKNLENDIENDMENLKNERKEAMQRKEAEIKEKEAEDKKYKEIFGETIGEVKYDEDVINAPVKRKIIIKK